jgi:hypothetical protein
MSRKAKMKSHKMLIQCEKCGEPFYFVDHHDKPEETQANFDWAMTHVTLCHECRPHRVRFSPNALAGLPGIWGTD